MKITEAKIRFKAGEEYSALNETGNEVRFLCSRVTFAKASFYDCRTRRKTNVKRYVNENGVEYCYPLGIAKHKPILFARVIEEKPSDEDEDDDYGTIVNNEYKQE